MSLKCVVQYTLYWQYPVNIRTMQFSPSLYIRIYKSRVELRQCCLPRYLRSSQRGWPWPWPWWGGSISDRPRTDAGTELSDLLPRGACAPCRTRTQPAVSPSPPGASGQNEWLGKETDRQKQHTLVHGQMQAGRYRKKRAHGSTTH